MAQKPSNWNQMSPEDKALWTYINAGDEFSQGGAADYKWQNDLQLQTLGSAPQQGRTALGGVTTDPKLLESQMKALAAMEQQAETGLSAADENALNRSGRKLASDANSVAQTVEQRLARQGRGGGRLGVTMQMQAAQAAQQAAADQAADRNAQAQDGRLNARMGAGQLAGNMSGEEYRRKANAATAEDTINRFNVQNTTGRQEYNNNTTNNGLTYNNQGRQGVANQNSSAQYDFRKDKMGVTQDGAKVSLEKSNNDYNRAQLKKQAKAGKVGKMFSGATTGAAAGAPLGPWGMAGGAIIGAAANYAHGGKVPGEPELPYDSLYNDNHMALLSPGEIVVPVSAASDPRTAAAFAAQAADPFASIKNPQTREYYRKKLSAQKELEDAQDTQKWTGIANGVGSLINDYSNNQKEDVILKSNFLAGSNLKPEVIKADRPAWDSSALDKIGAAGVAKAQGKMAQAGKDLDEQMKFRDIDRADVAYDRSNVVYEREQALQKGDSAESASARAFVLSQFPNAAKIPGFENMSAAVLDKKVPLLMERWKADAAQRNSDREYGLKSKELDIKRDTLNKPNAAQGKLLGEVRSATGLRDLRNKSFADIENAFNDKDAMTGPVMGRIGKTLNENGFSAGKATDEMNVKSGKLLAAYVKDISGATVPDSEMKRLTSLMPTGIETPSLFKTKMAALKNETDAVVNKARMDAGLPPIQFQEAEADKPETKAAPHGNKVKQDGITYIWNGTDYVPE